jgi:ABC-type dipeptide/oligopeptide/nickel transport system ATPase subunit
VLKKDPTNAEAYKELQALRKDCRQHAQDLVAKQRETWTKVFGGRTIIEGEEEKEEGPPPTIRPCWDYSRHSWVSLNGVSIRGQKGCSLDKFNMELREAWCVGLWTPGENVGVGAALAGIAAKKQSPDLGRVTVNRRPEWVYIDPLILAAATVVFVAVLLLAQVSGASLTMVGILGGIGSIILAPLVAMWLMTRATSKVDVVLITSAAFEVLRPRSTVESVIGDLLPKKVDPLERRERVISMLRASGCFEKPEQSIRNGILVQELSEPQRQIVAILRGLTLRPHVLICVEPLGGLDKVCQLRILRMIKRMKQDLKTSVLYISADPGHLRLISDSFGLLANGGMPELGPTEEVMGAKPGPRAEEMREALASARPPASSVWDEGPEVGADWLERAQALVDDKALDAAWLPNNTGSVPKYN